MNVIPFFASHEEVGDLRGSPASSWSTFLGRENKTVTGNTSKHTRRLSASSLNSKVSRLTPDVIDPGEITTITVTARDSDGNLITTGGEYFLVGNNYMTDNGNGTYSYSVTLNYAGIYRLIMMLQDPGQVSKKYKDLTKSYHFIYCGDNKINDIYPDPIHLRYGSCQFYDHTNIEGEIEFYLLPPTSSPITFYKKIANHCK